MNSVQKSSELVTIVDAASANSHTVAQHCEQTAKVAVAPMQAMKAWEVSRFGLCCFELGVAGCSQGPGSEIEVALSCRSFWVF